MDEEDSSDTDASLGLPPPTRCAGHFEKTDEKKSRKQQLSSVTAEGSAGDTQVVREEVQKIIDQSEEGEEASGYSFHEGMDEGEIFGRRSSVVRSPPDGQRPPHTRVAEGVTGLR